MTDEEMAEEYKESKRHKCFRADVGKIQIEYEAYLNNLKDGFLAGLKAGRPQWHDLWENSNDLPEKMGLGSKEVYVAYENGVTDFACYRFDKKYWERSENEELAVNVISWCEIPTFDKE